ncbi:MAG: menaquinone biosynthesis protein [Bryobacterales bacterium]|nr:menaquinone biosynthesis protein [Bryobacterales bacterium]
MSTTDASSTRLPRVCAVSFLNTVPLIWGMLHGEQKERFDLSLAIPAECADRLASGEADIGIVPAVELLHQDLEILRGTGIASDGAVRSILLVTKVAPASIRTLAADSSSRASVMLSRIVLDKRYGARPRYISRPPRLRAMLAECDAALLIGDPALRIEPAALEYECLDLGEIWTQMTGLPMVFAVWAGKREFANPATERLFVDSCRFGKAHLDDIIQEHVLPRGLRAELGREYLTRHIISELGPREYQGLDLYLKYATEHERRA